MIDGAGSPDSAKLSLSLSPFLRPHQQEDSGSVTRSSTPVTVICLQYCSTTFTGPVVILREDSVSWARPRGSLSDSGSVRHCQATSRAGCFAMVDVFLPLYFDHPLSSQRSM